MVAMGMTRKAIALEFGLSAKGVDWILWQAGKRIGVSDTAGFTRYAIMKKLIPLRLKFTLALVWLGLAGLVQGATAAGTATNAVNVTFVWDAPANQSYTGLVYRIYSSTNVALPTNSWPLLAVVTNPVPINAGAQLSYSVPLVPGAYFFTMTSSNFWGASFFSEAAATPPPVPQLNNLTLQRGP